MATIICTRGKLGVLTVGVALNEAETRAVARVIYSLLADLRASAPTPAADIPPSTVPTTDVQSPDAKS